MSTYSMENSLRKLKKFKNLITILDLGSLEIYGLIPPHVIHLHLISCKTQVNITHNIDF